MQYVENSVVTLSLSKWLSNTYHAPDAVLGTRHIERDKTKIVFFRGCSGINPGCCRHLEKSQFLFLPLKLKEKKIHSFFIIHIFSNL